MNTLQFRGLCLCFIYFCLRSCSLQNFPPFLDARVLHWALWFSPCHKPPWHPGGDSHSHHRLDIPIFKYQTCWDRTGHQFSHRVKHMEERNAHRLHQWWCRHRIRGTKSHGGWGHLDTNTCANPSHHPVLQGYGAFLWVCLFYPSTNILFSFPRQTRRIHPARTGMLQVKTWIRPNTTCVCLERR